MKNAPLNEKKPPCTATKAKVALTTLGCKVNQCDSAALACSLAAANFELTQFNAFADAYIINTCTVTAFADFQARQLIRRAFRKNPLARIIVTGCYAQTQPATLGKLEGVTFVVSNENKQQIADLLSKAIYGDWRNSPRATALPKQSFPAAAGLTGRTRAFLKIQDGCDAFCSYCIVPLARGASRSLSFSGVQEGVGHFISQNYQEIVLTGIHLGNYGQDLHPQINLSDALEILLDQYPDVRFRLSSIEPNEISDKLLALFGQKQNLCPHLHIPLQSGDDQILQAMKRQYNVAQYRLLIEKAVQAADNISIGADVMTGFPGEDEKEFCRTLEFLADLPVSYLHVFTYSERPGTAARHLGPKVPEKIKKERAALLRDLSKKKKDAFARRFLGKTLPVLVEQTRDKKTGLYKGFSHNYLSVLVDDASSDSVNKLVDVQIKHYCEERLLGKIAHE